MLDIFRINDLSLWFIVVILPEGMNVPFPLHKFQSTLGQWSMFFKMLIHLSSVAHCKFNILVWNVLIQSVSNQHCGYWWPGALAPGHQYPQCWESSHAFTAVYGLLKWLCWIFCLPWSHGGCHSDSLQCPLSWSSCQHNNLSVGRLSLWQPSMPHDMVKLSA